MSAPGIVPITGPDVCGSVDFALDGLQLDVRLYAEPSDADEMEHPAGSSLHLPITSPEQAEAIGRAWLEWAEMLRQRQRANEPPPPVPPLLALMMVPQ